MKKRIKKTVLKAVAAMTVTAVLMCLRTVEVRAEYQFVRTGAQEAGTVSVEALPGTMNANGYSNLSGYRVTYTISRDDWVAFDEQTGGYFLTGSSLDAGGGCQFAYHTSGGAIWENGAIILGRINDSSQIAKCNVSDGTVSCSFDVGSLEEIPNYIAYAYHPASSAYIHITEEYGVSSHVWYYQDLRNANVIEAGVDTKAPTLTMSVLPGQNAVTVNGKTWTTEAQVQVIAVDDQSGPGCIRLYRNGVLLQKKENSNNESTVQMNYAVTANGTYEADAYDKLNNTSNKKSVAVSCIDREAPVIEEVSVADEDYTKETKIIATAADEGCGLNNKAYSWNGGAWTDEKEFKVTDNGIYTLKVRDALGNESTETITVSNIDRNAPELTVKCIPTGKVMIYQGEFWTTEAVLSVAAEDTGSGVKEVLVYDEAENVLISKSCPENIKSEMLEMENIEIRNGRYKIVAKDMLGNYGVKDDFTVSHVDSEAPVMKEVKIICGEDGIVTLQIIAKDGEDGIGLADEAYSFDGGKTWQAGNSITVDANGIYELCVRDRLMQEARETAQVTQVPEKETGEEQDGGTEQPLGGQPAAPEPITWPVTIQPVTGQILHSRVSYDLPDKISNKNANIQKEMIVPEEKLAEAEEKILKQLSPEESDKTASDDNKKANVIHKAVLAGLLTIFAAGCVGLILYALLFYYRNSCVLYGIDEEKKQHRLCRLFIKENEDEWQVEVPMQKLGDCGTGEYVLRFHPSFVKDESPAFVTIIIDGKVIREKLTGEVYISI